MAEGEKRYRMGDVGDRAYVIQGDNNNVVFNPALPDASTLLERGVRQLEAGSDLAAADTLRSAIGQDSSLRMAYFYLALALLRGSRPRQLKREQVSEIDRVLTAAVSSDQQDSLFHWFRALIREDYYHGNRLICPPPSVDQVVRAALAGHADRRELGMLLDAVPVSGGSAVYATLARVVGS